MPFAEAMQPPFSPADRRADARFWLMRHLLGEDRSRRWAGRSLDALRSRQAQALAAAEGELLPVPELPAMSAADFVAGPLRGLSPVVFRGAARDWPAVQRWTPQWFADNYGAEPVRLLHMAPEDVGQGRYDGVDTTVGDAIAHLDQGNASYIRFLPTLVEDPKARDMLDMAWLRDRRGPLSPPGNLHLFIGGEGTETGTHTAVPANLFVQVHGRKRWHMYAPAWAPVLEPPMERAMYFSSAWDPDHPDLQRFPLCRHLRGYTVELQPGDVLYNPPFWWHKILNPTVSVGVGFRWFPPHLCFRASPIMWLLTYLSVNPPFWVGAQLKLDFTKIFTVPRRG